MRIRDDKHHGNHRSIVEKILKSIRDGVDADTLVQAAPAIRSAWKTSEREKKRQEAGQLPASTSASSLQQISGSVSSVTPASGSVQANYDPTQLFGGIAYRGVKGKAPPLPRGGPANVIRR